VALLPVDSLLTKETHDHNRAESCSIRQVILKCRPHDLVVLKKQYSVINPYPANVENMVSS